MVRGVEKLSFCVSVDHFLYALHLYEYDMMSIECLDKQPPNQTNSKTLKDQSELLN